MKKRVKLINVLISIFGVMGIISVFITDKLFLNIPILIEGFPNFNSNYILRSILLFIFLCLMFIGLVKNKKNDFSIFDENLNVIIKLGVFTIHILSILFLFLFIFDPYHFDALSREDYPIEWCSAIFLFGSSFIFLFLFFRTPSTRNISNITKLGFLLLSFLFFTIAMEEVSWFQRILKIETPEFLKTNEQNEINFHNLYSDISENVYYFGSFVFLIVFPFLNFLFPKCLFSKHLKPIIPKPFVAIIVAVGYSYNFDMWNSIITQITFFSCLIILSYFAYFSKYKIEKILVLFSLLLLIVQQLIFLNYPNNYVRLWEITEYKEFFITVGFFAYSLNSLRTLDLIKISKIIN
jgi:hypothetical protein